VARQKEMVSAIDDTARTRMCICVGGNECIPASAGQLIPVARFLWAPRYAPSLLLSGSDQVEENFVRKLWRKPADQHPCVHVPPTCKPSSWRPTAVGLGHGGELGEDSQSSGDSASCGRHSRDGCNHCGSGRPLVIKLRQKLKLSSDIHSHDPSHGTILSRASMQTPRPF
jgi:hypothetical protein